MLNALSECAGGTMGRGVLPVAKWTARPLSATAGSVGRWMVRFARNQWSDCRGFPGESLARWKGLPVWARVGVCGWTAYYLVIGNLNIAGVETHDATFLPVILPFVALPLVALGFRIGRRFGGIR